MFEKLRCHLVASLRFRGYEPQPITQQTVFNWVNQFEKHERRYLPTLLKHIKYINAAQTKNILVSLNTRLLTKLETDGIPAQNVIYVSVDDAGSSSPFMLSVLRNAARLEQLACPLLDSKDIRGLHATTDKLGEGAIVYVDDFAGTGNQLCKSRDYAIQHTVGNFAEFLLAPYVCEEAIEELEKRGIEHISEGVHRKTDRVLRSESTILSQSVREHLAGLCWKIDSRFGLGYRNLGSMIVFYRNAPNSLPLVLRGSRKQNPYVGLLPRTTDL